MEEGGDWRRGVFWLAGAALSAVLAMKTKEFAFTLPLAVLLYEASFFRGPWKRRFLYLLPVLLTLPIVPLGVLAAGKPAGELLSDVSERMRMQTDIPRLHYLFTQFRVIVTYLRLLVLPIDQNLDYDYTVYNTFFTPPVLFSFLLLAVLFLLALYLYGITARIPGSGSPSPLVSRLSSRSADPAVRMIGFGIVWFFLALSVESSVIPISDVIFEHRLYLPSIGAAAAVATAFVLVCDKVLARAWGKMALVVAGLVVVALGLGTYERNAVWGDSVGLWEDVVRKSPGKGRPYNNLGASLNDAGRPMDAVRVLTRAVWLQPGDFDAYYNLGRSYLLIGQNAAAVEATQTAIRLKPDFDDAYVNLAAALNRERRFQEAVTLLEQHLGRLGDRADAHFNLGVAYVSLGNREAAVRELGVVSRLDARAAQTLASLLR